MPTCGSVAILKTRPENGAAGSASRVTVFLGLRIDAFDRRDVQRRRQEIDHRIEQRLHALVLERTAGEDRDQLAGQGCLAESGLQVLDGDFLAFEVLHHQVFVGFGNELDQVRAGSFGPLKVLRGDFDLADVLAFIVEVHDRDHVEQVDHAAELGLDADRHLDRRRGGLEAIDDHLDRAVERRAGPVELVDEADARDVVLVGLAPDGFGLRLDAGHAVEDHDAAVEHAKRALDLDREVDVARACRSR